MKNEYINAITADLIKELDYVPLRDKYGGFVLSGGDRTFEKRDISTYSIVELIDADSLTPEDMKTHILSNLKWMRQAASTGMHEAPSMVEVFVFSSTPATDVINVLKEHNYMTASGIRLITNVIADMYLKRVLAPYDAGFPVNAVEMILNDRIKGHLDGYETLPDIGELVDGTEPSQTIEEVAKGSPATFVFIGINIVIWLLGRFVEYIYGIDYITLFGIKYAPNIVEGEYWRLITPMFLHADMTHLGANSFSLFIFGQVVERIFGTGKFIAIYLISGIIGNIASFAFTKAPSLGASGAVLGIGGALIYIWRRHRYVFSGRKRQYLTLVFLAFFNVIYGFSHQGIDNFAHLGGAISGYLAGGTVYLKNDSIRSHTRLIFVVLLIALSVAGLIIGFGNIRANTTVGIHCMFDSMIL